VAVRTVEIIRPGDNIFVVACGPCLDELQRNLGRKTVKGKKVVKGGICDYCSRSE
jgi:hypothetical protein